MVVLIYAIEVEILNNLEAPRRDKILRETSRAYLARSKCLEALGRQKAALVDLKRAEDLEASAKKLAVQTTPPAKDAVASQIRLINNWSGTVTVVVDGMPYRLEVGEQKTIATNLRVVPYEMQAGPFRGSGTMEAGRTYTIKAPSP